MKNYFEGIEAVSNRPPSYTPEEAHQAEIELEARETERKRVAQMQADDEARKRATGELPLASDEEAAIIARRLGVGLKV
jgi:hypothetical protein